MNIVDSDLDLHCLLRPICPNTVDLEIFARPLFREFFISELFAIS